jgi:hypothetical protein
MPAVSKCAEAGFDVFPPAFILERVSNCLGYERASTSSADTPIELLHEVVVKAYVQTHGHNLAHSSPWSLFASSLRCRHLISSPQQIPSACGEHPLRHALP